MAKIPKKELVRRKKISVSLKRYYKQTKKGKRYYKKERARVKKITVSLKRFYKEEKIAKENLTLYEDPELRKFKITKNIIKNSYKIAEIIDATKMIKFDIWNYAVNKTTSLKRRTVNKLKGISVVTMKYKGFIDGKKFVKEIAISKGKNFKQNMAKATFGFLHSMLAFNSKYKSDEEEQSLIEKGFNPVEDFSIEYYSEFY